MDPFFILKTDYGFEQASSALEAAVTHHGFGVLAIHDLGQILRLKGINFVEECRVFEVCNPMQAARVLGIQIKLSMALPCRICIYIENNQTHIGMIRPENLLLALSPDEELKSVATEVECSMIEIIQKAAGSLPCATI